MDSTSAVDELNDSISNPKQITDQIGTSSSTTTTTNGVCDPKIDKSPPSEEPIPIVQGNGKGIDLEDDRPEGTSPNSPQLPSPPTTKGYGLKKWRRIRRDVSKDGSNALDSNKNLKRGLPNPKLSPKTPHLLSHDINIANDAASVASTDSYITTPTMMPTAFALSHPRLMQGPAFAFGATDSDNSEDQSSKSSTAASAPRFRFPNAINTRDKSKGNKYPSGETSGPNLTAQLGKGSGPETTKKFRGDKKGRIEKDNSYSSVESDLRSSNILFPENGSFSGIISGRQMERSSNYDGESSIEALASNQHSSEEVRMDSCKGNGGEADDDSQIDDGAELSWEEKEEESINLQSSTSHDPLDEAIISLQAVQDALQEEIDKFRALGREPSLLPNDVTRDLETHGLGSSSQLHSDEVQKIEALHGEEGVLETNHKICLLEEKLEDALYKLEVKESMVAELEDIVRKNELPQGGSGSQTVQERLREMEVEVESLYRQKIEAELEYVAITKATEELKVAVKDQLDKLLEGERSVTREQQESLHKVLDAETSEALGGRKEGEAESCNRELVRGEEVLGSEGRICKYAVCFFVQLILLLLAFLLLQLPNSTGTVPT
ncbi:hypothetical protein Scep_013631 [Stephania cephalantha]|uniref:WPP domain-interacting protein 2 n=1 Tax=Stephania cephalantha TaxID=152367 RepID=A0AAP0JJ51_9MAGN